MADKLSNTLSDHIANRMPFDSAFVSIPKSKIRQVVGQAVITGTGTNMYAFSLSDATGGRITNNDNVIAVSVYSYNSYYICIGNRISATPGNLVVLFQENVSNNTQVALRFNITYYTA